jgi:hypothetical protein
MSTVEQIEDAILKFPSDDFRRLAEWLLELEEQRWDAQIAADVASGKLDKLAARAIEHYKAGNYREL